MQDERASQSNNNQCKGVWPGMRNSRWIFGTTDWDIEAILIMEHNPQIKKQPTGSVVIMNVVDEKRQLKFSKRKDWSHKFEKHGYVEIAADCCWVLIWAEICAAKSDHWIDANKRSVCGHYAWKEERLDRRNSRVVRVLSDLKQFRSRHLRISAKRVESKSALRC